MSMADVKIDEKGVTNFYLPFLGVLCATGALNKIISENLREWIGTQEINFTPKKYLNYQLNSLTN